MFEVNGSEGILYYVLNIINGYVWYGKLFILNFCMIV